MLRVVNRMSGSTAANFDKPPLKSVSKSAILKVPKIIYCHPYNLRLLIVRFWIELNWIGLNYIALFHSSLSFISFVIKPQFIQIFRGQNSTRSNFDYLMAALKNWKPRCTSETNRWHIITLWKTPPKAIETSSCFVFGSGCTSTRETCTHGTGIHNSRINLPTICSRLTTRNQWTYLGRVFHVGT